MSHSRTTAALLAFSALLCAGWTKTTHWHFSGHAQGHSSSPVNSTVGECCFGRTLAGESHASLEALPALGDSPTVESDQSRNGDHCSVCDFLAGHVYALAMLFESAGMLAECQCLPEPLNDSPVSQQRWVSCRGPPLVA
jgi:hypothetical protein